MRGCVWDMHIIHAPHAMSYTPFALFQIVANISQIDENIEITKNDGNHTKAIYLTFLTSPTRLVAWVSSLCTFIADTVLCPLFQPHQSPSNCSLQPITFHPMERPALSSPESSIRMLPLTKKSIHRLEMPNSKVQSF